MNKLIMMVVAVAFSAPVFAEQRYSEVGGNQAGAVSGSAAIVNFNTPEKQQVEYSGTQTLKNVPAIGAPALITSNDTCQGSTSGGVAVAGFGFSLGSTWTDNNCLMLKNSRELWNMGFKAAAMARMCMDDLNKEALEVTGFKCPTKKEAEPK
jgi:hypothetical protein